MGMDSIEILMKVEESFGIKIPDREAEQILTVGDFHDAVWRQLPGKYSDRCKSQTLFYKLRKLISETFNLSKQQFLLHTCPNEVFPQQNRRKIYFAFARATNLVLPTLILNRRSRMCLNTFGVVTILGGLAVAVILINFFDYPKWILLMPVAGIGLTILLSNMMEPNRTVIDAPDIRSFTEKTLALNYAVLATEQGTNRREMEMVINHIIADMVGLDLQDLTPGKKIADDLGID